jgi:hypothetical protein
LRPSPAGCGEGLPSAGCPAIVGQRKVAHLPSADIEGIWVPLPCFDPWLGLKPRSHQVIARMTNRAREAGKVGWILLWALGIPVPILLLLFVLRGCT